ncbi:hypothetical protein DFH08DRAFT_897069 [Mycena albidolilacea]|uniref:Uncharacterized protein n=1 Tax=Mycena albidolilacea TaxID=1033008 RepID=A0AAD6Z9I5_9AGAR|nr:hypothetical protein DFH08DRAFT_897069 [Mycena albidolilacea]
MPALDASLTKAIMSHLHDPRNKPCGLAVLPDWAWPKSFENSDASDPDCLSSATDREYFYQIGLAILNQTIFLILLEDLRGMPAGYSQAIQGAVTSATILRMIMGKIDPRLVGYVKNVDKGFQIFVGLHWLKSAGDMHKLLRWLQPIFEPLVCAARAAYIEFEKSRKVSNKKGGPELHVGGGPRLPADMIFLLKLRQFQKEAPVSPSADSSSDSSNCTFELSVGGNGSPFRLKTVEQDATENFLPAISPTTFVSNHKGVEAEEIPSPGLYSRVAKSIEGPKAGNSPRREDEARSRLTSYKEYLADLSPHRLPPITARPPRTLTPAKRSGLGRESDGFKVRLLCLKTFYTV